MRKSTRVSRRTALKFGAATAALPLVHIGTGRAAGRLSVGFWDHWVPAGSGVLAKQCQAWAEKKPVEWVRVHYLARHAHFPHQRHIKALGPNACTTCHGDVDRMPQVFKVNNVNNMGFCITCHVERKVSRDCSVCHY